MRRNNRFANCSKTRKALRRVKSRARNRRNRFKVKSIKCSFHKIRKKISYRSAKIKKIDVNFVHKKKKKRDKDHLTVEKRDSSKQYLDMPVASDTRKNNFTQQPDQAIEQQEIEQNNIKIEDQFLTGDDNIWFKQNDLSSEICDLNIVKEEYILQADQLQNRAISMHSVINLTDEFCQNQHEATEIYVSESSNNNLELSDQFLPSDIGKGPYQIQDNLNDTSLLKVLATSNIPVQSRILSLRKRKQINFRDLLKGKTGKTANATTPEQSSKQSSVEAKYCPLKAAKNKTEVRITKSQKLKLSLGIKDYTNQTVCNTKYQSSVRTKEKRKIKNETPIEDKIKNQKQLDLQHKRLHFEKLQEKFKTYISKLQNKLDSLGVPTIPQHSALGLTNEFNPKVRANNIQPEIEQKTRIPSQKWSTTPVDRSHLERSRQSALESESDEATIKLQHNNPSALKASPIQSKIRSSLSKRKKQINWRNYLNTVSKPAERKLALSNTETEGHSPQSLNKNNCKTRKKKYTLKNWSSLKRRQQRGNETSVQVRNRRKRYHLRRIKESIEVKMNELHELKTSLSIEKISTQRLASNQFLEKGYYKIIKEQQKVYYLRMLELRKEIKMLIRELQKLEISLRGKSSPNESLIKLTERSVVKDEVQQIQDHHIDKQINEEHTAEKRNQSLENPENICHTNCAENEDISFPSALKTSEVDNSLTPSETRLSQRKRECQNNYSKDFSYSETSKRPERFSYHYLAELESLFTDNSQPKKQYPRYSSTRTSTDKEEIAPNLQENQGSVKIEDDFLSAIETKDIEEWDALFLEQSLIKNDALQEPLANSPSLAAFQLTEDNQVQSILRAAEESITPQSYQNLRMVKFIKGTKGKRKIKNVTPVKSKAKHQKQLDLQHKRLHFEKLQEKFKTYISKLQNKLDSLGVTASPPLGLTDEFNSKITAINLQPEIIRKKRIPSQKWSTTPVDRSHLKRSRKTQEVEVIEPKEICLEVVENGHQPVLKFNKSHKAAKDLIQQYQDQQVENRIRQYDLPVMNQLTLDINDTLCRPALESASYEVTTTMQHNNPSASKVSQTQSKIRSSLRKRKKQINWRNYLNIVSKPAAQKLVLSNTNTQDPSPQSLNNNNCKTTKKKYTLKKRESEISEQHRTRRKRYHLKRIKNSIEVKMNELHELKNSLSLEKISTHRLASSQCLVKGYYKKIKEQQKVNYLRTLELRKEMKMLISELHKLEISLRGKNSPNETLIKPTATSVVKDEVQQIQDQQLENAENVCHTNCTNNEEVSFQSAMETTDIHNPRPPSETRFSQRIKECQSNYSKDFSYRLTKKPQERFSYHYLAELESLFTDNSQLEKQDQCGLLKKNLNQLSVGNASQNMAKLKYKNEKSETTQKYQSTEKNSTRGIDELPQSRKKLFNHQAEDISVKSGQKHCVLQKIIQHKPAILEDISSTHQCRDLSIVEFSKPNISPRVFNTLSPLSIKRFQCKEGKTNEENPSHSDPLEPRNTTLNISQQPNQNQSQLSEECLNESNIHAKMAHLRAQRKYKSTKRPRKFVSRDPSTTQKYQSTEKNSLSLDELPQGRKKLFNHQAEDIGVKSVQKHCALQKIIQHKSAILKNISSTHQCRDLSVVEFSKPNISPSVCNTLSPLSIKRFQCKEGKTNEEHPSHSDEEHPSHSDLNISQQPNQNQSQLSEEYLDESNIHAKMAHLRAQRKYKSTKRRRKFVTRDPSTPNDNNKHGGVQSDFLCTNRFQNTVHEDVVGEYEQQSVSPVASNHCQPALEDALHEFILPELYPRVSATITSGEELAPNLQESQIDVKIEDEMEIKETEERDVSVLEQSLITDDPLEEPPTNPPALQPTEDYHVQSILRAAEHTVIPQSGQNLRIVQVIKVKYQ